MRKPRKQFNRHPLYKLRTTTEKMNVAFDFVRENWRQWLMFSLYFMLPVSVIQGTATNLLWEVLFADKAISWVIPVLFFTILFVGLAIDTALMILFIKWCQTHSDGLSQCTMSHLRRVMPAAAFKCLLAWLLIFVESLPAIIVALVITIAIPFSAFIVIVFFLFLPLSMMFPIYLLEENATFGSTFRRANSLGFKRWGSIIWVAIVAWLTVSFLGNFITIPLVVAEWVKNMLSVKTEAALYVWKMVLNVLTYVLNVLHCYVMYLGVAMFMLVMTYHYGSVAAEVEDIDLESDIDNFANK